MDRQEKIAMVTEAARKEGYRLKLACPRAFRLSAEHGITLREIGRICNEAGIAVSKCQLGCFD